MSNDTVAVAKDTMRTETGNYWIALANASRDIARAFECGIPNCDKTSHEGGEAPDEWTHRVYHSNVDGLEVEINRHADGTHNAWYAVEYINDADSKDLREMAASLSTFALELAATAERIDELNKAVI